MGVNAIMAVVLPEPIDDASRRRACYDLCESFGPGQFIIERERDRHALHVQAADPDDVDPWGISDAWLPRTLWVSQLWAYYGVDYERGPLPLIINVAMWLEKRFAGARVYYGPDSANVAELTAPAKVRLLNYFFQHGHRPYLGNGCGTCSDMNPHGCPDCRDRPRCAFCGDQLMHCVAWRHNRPSEYVCHGCDNVRRIGPVHPNAPSSANFNL